MAPDPTRMRLAVPDHVITRVVGGSTVILDVHSGRSFTLDEVGSRVWALLESTGTVRDTIERLSVEFDSDTGQLERDVIQLLDELVGASLLTANADHA